MAIKVKAIAKKNPLKPKDEPKFYAQVLQSDELTLRDIVDDIALNCTLTGSDIKAVLDALMTSLKHNLGKGNVLRLGDLGSFRVSVSSKGEVTAKACTSRAVKKARIIFVPSAELKETVKVFSFTKVSTDGTAETPEEKPDEGGEEEAPDPML